MAVSTSVVETTDTAAIPRAEEVAVDTATRVATTTEVVEAMVIPTPG